MKVESLDSLACSLASGWTWRKNCCAVWIGSYNRVTHLESYLVMIGRRRQGDNSWMVVLGLVYRWVCCLCHSSDKKVMMIGISDKEDWIENRYYLIAEASWMDCFYHLGMYVGLIGQSRDFDCSVQWTFLNQLLVLAKTQYLFIGKTNYSRRILWLYSRKLNDNCSNISDIVNNWLAKF